MDTTSNDKPLAISYIRYSSAPQADGDSEARHRDMAIKAVDKFDNNLIDYPPSDD